jgi:hypothetical protein
VALALVAMTAIVAAAKAGLSLIVKRSNRCELKVSVMAIPFTNSAHTIR